MVIKEDDTVNRIDVYIRIEHIPLMFRTKPGGVYIARSNDITEIISHDSTIYGVIMYHFSFFSPYFMKMKILIV